MNFLHASYLKPETVSKIENLGPLAIEAADRWLGGWPKQTLRLEKDGTLIQALKDHVEESFEAISYKFSHQELNLTTSEALQMFDLPLWPPRGSEQKAY